MSFTKPISRAALAFLLFQGVMGNPVTKTAYEDYGSSISTPTPTSSGYEDTWDACGNYSSPYGCPSSSSSKTTTTACPSLCVDYINECGMMYGGCFADPKCTGGTAWPTFAKPPCPTSSPTFSACPTICADYINDCGQMYGGCFPDPTCTGGTAWPTFSKPPCPTTTSYAAITTVSSSTKACSTTICSDYINSCGEVKGICFLDTGCTANGVFPTTFVPPPCTTATASKCNTICVDKVNSCGQKYGGCFPDPTCTGGTAWPSFSTPSCPSGTGSSSVYVTTVTPPAYPSTKVEIDTVTSYTSIAPDTVTVTSTSQTLIVPSSPAAGTAAAGNGTRTGAVSPTASPAASQSALQPVFTGEAVRNRIGCVVVAVFVAVGAALL